MDTNKIASTILDLENVVSSAEELHAITLLQYDSFVEGKCFSNESEFYKTITSIIEREKRVKFMGSCRKSLMNCML